MKSTLSTTESDEMFEIRVLVDNSEAGIIIGKGGSNVQKIRSETGCFISILKSEAPSIKERIMVVKGAIESNSQALLLVCQLLIDARNEKDQGASDTYSIKILIHKFLAGCIIGKGGLIIKEIQTETGARVQLSNDPMPNSTEKTVTITGNTEVLYMAISRVLNQLKNNPLRSGSASILYVPGGNPQQQMYGSQGMHYGGGGGPPPSQYGAPPPEYGYGGGMPYGMGNRMGMGMDMEGMPPQHGYGGGGGGGGGGYGEPTKTEKIVIPSICAGTVIGKGGGIISNIKQQSGTQISIGEPEASAPDDRIVSIYGTPQQIQSAVSLIRQRVESYRPQKGGEGAGY